MSANETSLLLRIRGEASSGKAAVAETRAAVTQLRQSLGPQLTQTTTIANQAFTKLGDNLNVFVAQRLPLVGGAFVRVTENLRGLGNEGPKTEKAVSNAAKSIESIASQSGKSVPQVASFLKTFVQLEGQAKRNDAAFKFFGGSVDLAGNKTAKFLPELEQAGTEMLTATTAAEGLGATLAGLAGPIAIAVAAFAAEVAVVISLTNEIFELTKASAEYQGRLFDLSQQTGISAETLSALEVVARTTGSSIENLTQSLGIFQKNLEEAQDAGSKAGVAFKKLGVDTTDTESALRQTIAALARMPEGFRQTALALEVFGRGGKSFLAIAKESNGDIDQITARLKNLGLVTTDQAKLADEFNDQLVILEIQLRGLGTKAIPVVLDALKSLSKLLEDNRGTFELLQKIVRGVATALAIELKIAIGVIETAFIAAIPIIKPAVELFERLKPGIDLISGHPVTLFGSSSATQQPPSTPPIDEEAKFTKELRDEIEARKVLQGVLEVESAKRRQQAEANIAQAQRELEAGRRTRKEALDATINGLRQQTQAEIDSLNVDRGIKLAQAALAKDDISKRNELGGQILAIDVQIAAKRSSLETAEANARSKFRLEEQKADLAHEEAKLAILTRAGNERIAIIQEQINRDASLTQAGLDEIEKIENTTIQARGQLLKRELELAGVGPERQVVLDKIRALESDRTELERAQAERRKSISREELQTQRQILTANLETVVRLEQSAGERRSAAIQALADRRVITEEEAAKEILKIRLDLIDDEIEATKTKLTAASSITDKNERIKAEADLNNQIKVLKDQRVTIETEGNRAVDEARQKDIENERRYAEAIVTLRQRAVEVERDVAQSVINLLALNFARRLDIIRAQAKADIDEENRRNKQAQREIASLRHDVNESNRTREEKLQALLEIDELEETEADRHRLAIEEIRRRAALDEKNAEPLGRINIDLDNLKEFASIIENSIVPLGQILTNTFQQVADAIGETVQNWVLLGETGPAVMRKILAQALASIAAEAAVNAIKELALGFATLFFNPAESAAHFTAAALWASIGGVAAIAGRSVAGDLFKSKTSGGGATSPTSGGPSGQINPVTLSRNSGTPDQHVFVHIEANGQMMENFTIRTITKKFRRGSSLRDMINNDGGV